MMKQMDYGLALNKMRTGDGLFFRGGWLGWFLKCTHSARVVRTEVETDVYGGHPPTYRLEIVDVAFGVGYRKRDLWPVLQAYKGRIWWFPLSEYSRNKTNWERFDDFLKMAEEEKKPYSSWQAFKSWWDIFDWVPLLGRLSRNKLRIKNFFKTCSAFTTGIVYYCYTYPVKNPAEMLPMDDVKLPIWEATKYQIKGKPQSLP